MSDNVNHPSHYTAGMIEWRDFPRHPEYEVSDSGNVRRKNTGKERKCVKLKNGYLSVMIVQNGKYVLEYVHRAVAEAFIPNPDNLPQVNHKDKNKENNRVGNLEWCSAKENVQYSLGKKIEQLDDYGNVIRTFGGVREAERFFGVSHGSIGKAACGEYQKAYGYRWRYS